MHRVMLRYRAEVETPAAAIVGERKACRPSAVAKVAVDLGGGGAADDDAVLYYHEALEGVEPHLLRVAEPPNVTHLALRVSWPPESALRSFPPAAFVSSADRNMLVLYVGRYRPGLSTRGFYLVLDAWANSVAVIPRLPSRSVTMFSHGGIGTGVAVLRHGGGLPPPSGSEYLLAELLLRRDHGYTSCKATLFMWWSSGPVAGRWTQKEVMLPLPCDNTTFCADTVFAVGSRSLCWVDLLQGIVMCDDVFAADPRFRFIELPAGSSVVPGIVDGRGMPAARRSMCCVERHGDQILRFVAMDGYGQSQDPSGSVTITTWILRLVEVPTPTPKWEKSFSCRYGELIFQADPTQQLQHLVPTYPVLSLVDDHVVYITVPDDLASIPERLEESARTVLRIDMKHSRVLSSSKLPPGSGCTPVNIIASIFSSYLHKR